MFYKNLSTMYSLKSGLCRPFYFNNVCARNLFAAMEEK